MGLIVIPKNVVSLKTWENGTSKAIATGNMTVFIKRVNDGLFESKCYFGGTLHKKTFTYSEMVSIFGEA